MNVYPYVRNGNPKQISKWLMAKLENNKKVKYYFIDVFGDKVEVVPLMQILGNSFITCISVTTQEQLTIHRNRLRWEPHQPT